MPRSSSLAITIVRTAADVPAGTDDIRDLIHAAIEHVKHVAGLPETSDPSSPAAEAGNPDRGAVPGPGPLCPGDRS